MTRRSLLGLLLIAAALSLAVWLIGPFSSPPQSASYVCSGTDTLTTQAVDSAQIRLSRPDKSPVLLHRQDTGFGTTYTTSETDLLFWTRGSDAVLHDGGDLLLSNCSGPSKTGDNDGSRDTTTWYSSAPTPEGWRFAIHRPQSAELKRPNSRYTRVLYVGPANEPPALTDGFSVVVGFEKKPSTATLQEYVERTIEKQQPGAGPVLRPPRDTSHHKRAAVWWRQESAMGNPVTQWAIAINEGTVANVVTSVTSPDPDRYQRQVRALLQSLHFWRDPSSTSSANTVPLAMLTTPNGEPERGCDDILYVEHSVSPTASPVTAALDTLFAIERDSVGGARHFLGQTNSTLSFDKLVVSTDSAHVYLTGRLSGLRGVCDHPRARIQIEETVKRIADVSTVQIILNGTPTDLQPDGRGARSE